MSRLDLKKRRKNQGIKTHRKKKRDIIPEPGIKEGNFYYLRILNSCYDQSSCLQQAEYLKQE